MTRLTAGKAKQGWNDENMGENSVTTALLGYGHEANLSSSLVRLLLERSAIQTTKTHFRICFYRRLYRYCNTAEDLGLDAEVLASNQASPTNIHLHSAFHRTSTTLLNLVLSACN